MPASHQIMHAHETYERIMYCRRPDVRQVVLYAAKVLRVSSTRRITQDHVVPYHPIKTPYQSDLTSNAIKAHQPVRRRPHNFTSEKNAFVTTRYNVRLVTSHNTRHTTRIANKGSWHYRILPFRIISYNWLPESDAMHHTHEIRKWVHRTEQTIPHMTATTKTCSLSNRAMQCQLIRHRSLD